MFDKYRTPYAEVDKPVFIFSLFPRRTNKCMSWPVVYIVYSLLSYSAITSREESVLPLQRKIIFLVTYPFITGTYLQN